MTSNEKMQRYIDNKKTIAALQLESNILLDDVTAAESPFRKGDKIKYRRGLGQIISCSGQIFENPHGHVEFKCFFVRAYKLKQDGTPSKVEIRLHVDYDKIEKV